MTDSKIIDISQARTKGGIVGLDGQKLQSDKAKAEQQAATTENDLFDLFNVPYANVRTFETDNAWKIGILVCDGNPNSPDTNGKVFYMEYQTREEFTVAVNTLKALGWVAADVLNKDEPDPQPA